MNYNENNQHRNDEFLKYELKGRALGAFKDPAGYYLAACFHVSFLLFVISAALCLLSLFFIIPAAVILAWSLKTLAIIVRHQNGSYFVALIVGIITIPFAITGSLWFLFGGASNTRVQQKGAVAQYREAAEQGDAEAQLCLGACYYAGKGVEKNLAEAVKWLRKAAEQGHAMAQYRLGDCYEFGESVARDIAEAIKWYRRSAEQGHAEAQCMLGCHYADGDGVEENLTEAVNWYRKAAEQGDVNAQCSLGLYLYAGKGVEKDVAEAMKWLKKAAVQGNAQAKQAVRQLS